MCDILPSPAAGGDNLAHAHWNWEQLVKTCFREISTIYDYSIITLHIFSCFVTGRECEYLNYYIIRSGQNIGCIYLYTYTWYMPRIASKFTWILEVRLTCSTPPKARLQVWISRVPATDGVVKYLSRLCSIGINVLTCLVVVAVAVGLYP